jgi:hypothetical protein
VRAAHLFELRWGRRGFAIRSVRPRGCYSSRAAPLRAAPPHRPLTPPRRGFYLSALLAVAALACASGYRLALSHIDTPPQEVWEAPGYLPLWAASRGCLLLFQCAAARAAALALRPEEDNGLAAAAAAAGFGAR